MTSSAVEGSVKQSAAASASGKGAATAEESKGSGNPHQDAMNKPLRIGICCDANAYYNTDAKDPNKYECEGQKVPFAPQQITEYYLKLV